MVNTILKSRSGDSQYNGILCNESTAPVNDCEEEIIHPSMKDDIPMWLTLSSALHAERQDDNEDDYQDPDDDEILHTMFPDEDDDFWNDNFDIN